ncbi:MAG: hypothetical protein II445_01645, partial [Muribaculaceae bacterium]|nr:hypothetical protein [Muribaculaceae bacterium]
YKRKKIMKKNALLLFAVLLMPVLASAQGLVQAYIIDNDGAATNVRNAPNGKVVATLPTSEAFVVTLLDVKNGWWKIDSDVEQYGDDEKTITLNGSKTGYWIHQSLLMLATMGSNYTKLYKTPSTKGKLVFKGEKYLDFHPIGIKGEWVKVKSVDGKYTGWGLSDHFCTNPLTTCP